jgi:FkbM family methyltransferase
MSSQPDFAAFMQELESYRKSDPLRFLRAIAQMQNLLDPDLRFVRAEALHSLATGLHAGLRLCEFQNEVVVRAEGIFVNVGGVLMESSRSGMYWKPSGAPLRNQGEALANVLRRMHIDVETAVDVGANFGEITLWLAREYPGARIIAIEPSTDNLGVFEINRNAQNFPTRGVEVVRHAIAGKAGPASIPRVASGMNRITPVSNAEGTEIVQCECLDSLFDRHGIRIADFVKVDIEGAEPQLKEAMLKLGGRVRSYYIEFSQFAPFDDYVALAAALVSQKFVCYDETAALKLATIESIAQHLKSAFSPGPQTVTNLWFFTPR